jgi:hypothetical protein
MNIGSIVWPDDPESACHYYLGFATQVIQELGITFPGMRPDPLAIAKGYVGGTVSQEVCKAEAAAWWTYLESRGALGAPANRDDQMARLALCLLVTSDPLPELGTLVSWLLDVLGLMGYPSQRLVRMMDEYFSLPGAKRAKP